MCTHHVRPSIPYGPLLFARIERNRQLVAKGIKQLQCPTCRLWFWADEIGDICGAAGDGELICLLASGHEWKDNLHEANGEVW